jgi:GT2 family glycosyltransferase
MDPPIATVIIPNYNGMRFLAELRDSLRGQSERRFRVIVVDDASSDASGEFVAREWPEATLIRNANNLGFAGSCNRGLEAADTLFVVLLNNDTRVDVDWMREGLAAFTSEKTAGVASLILLSEPPHLVDSAGDLYSVAGGAQKRCHLQPRERVQGLPTAIFSACGASAFYRRDILARIGNMDAALGSYYDDVDIGFRLAWAGYDCQFAPRSICYHRLSASYDPRGWNYHFNSARNAEIIWRAYMPEALRTKYRWARRCYLMAQGVHKLRLGCLKAHLAGRRAAMDMGEHVEIKRAAMQQFATASPEEIESRLHRDWRGLHLRGDRRAPA